MQNYNIIKIILGTHVLFLLTYLTLSRTSLAIIKNGNFVTVIIHITVVIMQPITFVKL